MQRFFCALAICCTPFAQGAGQQAQPFSRAQAVAAALAHGPRLAVARSDTLVAAAQFLTAAAFPNPVLSASYSRSTPNYHVTAEVPLDFIGLRGVRLRSAEAARNAARYRFAYARAAIMLDADTTYTRALAATAHVHLSQRNAASADSVLQIAIARRDAGDASELDVQLARVSAGQATNVAAADTLTLVSTLLDLQALLGLPADSVVVRPTDSLVAPPVVPAPTISGQTLPVAGASASVASAIFTAELQHRSVLLFPSLIFGFETGDPGGSERGVLPTFGIAVPLPIFNRNRGPIAEADAGRQRANADLELAKAESQRQIAQARRGAMAAGNRVARDSLLIASANRVADMSLVAYREGAAPLATVLEAQRSARDLLAQYIDDLAAAGIAAATLYVLTLTPASVSQ